MMSRIGEKYTTKEGHTIEITDYQGNKNCTIKFEDNTVLYNTNYRYIVMGTIKNPNHPTVYGLGYLGIGKYKSQCNGEKSKIYYAWNNILERCYSKKLQLRKPTYIGCSIVKEWCNFQNFAKWYEENYIDGFQLDKDLLQKGNKIYSSNTCCFVPREINNLLTSRKLKRGQFPIGVTKFGNNYRATLTMNGTNTYIGTFSTAEEAFQAYKITKETHIKEVADRWRGQIAEPIYHTLYNYQVEITD